MKIRDDEASSERFPAIASWLEGAPSNHPWLELLTQTDPLVLLIGQALETILADIEKAGPERLARIRKAFRSDLLGVLNMRAELNVGWQLLQHNTRFAFGAEGEPDFECELGADVAWIEVTTKSRDDLSQLHDDIEEALAGHSVVVTLSIERRLVIPEAARRIACERLVTAAEAVGSTPCRVALPEVGAHAAMSAPSPLGGPEVALDIGANLAAHGDAVERFVRSTVEEKARQATRGEWDTDTLLVVDPSRLGISWIRPDSVCVGDHGKSRSVITGFRDRRSSIFAVGRSSVAGG